jgi:hypothetical protein
MLRQILDTFHQTPGPISLDLLAVQLGLERAVLEGMLDELVRLGRLVRVADRSGSACAACGFKNGCPYVLSVAGAYYALPEMIGINDAPC